MFINLGNNIFLTKIYNIIIFYFRQRIIFYTIDHPKVEALVVKIAVNM